MHHQALQIQCPSNSELPTDTLVYQAENRSRMAGCNALMHDNWLDYQVYSARYYRITQVFVNRYCRFTLVLLWLLETLCYSMGNRKYAS
jgi:hypothetical protein